MEFMSKNMNYKSIKHFTTADWGKTAITGLLAGFIAQSISGVFQAVLDFAGLLGFLSLCVWIYRTIKGM
jgi:hypothetical protein